MQKFILLSFYLIFQFGKIDRQIHMLHQKILHVFIAAENTTTVFKKDCKITQTCLLCVCVSLSIS